MKRKRTQCNFLMLTPRKMQTTLITFLIGLLMIISAWMLETAKAPPLPQSGAAPALYANQIDSDLTHTFIQAIDSAKKSVLLLVYTLTDQNIIAALRDKSRQGIDVKVICDAKASPYIDSKLGPKIDVIRRFGRGIMHLKILVIDDEVTWIGSANMTGDSLRLHGNLVIGVDNPTMAQFVTAKAKTLREEGSGPPFYHQEFNSGGQRLELWFLPDNRDASLKLKSLIRSAQKTIRIAMFTWTRHDLAKTIVDAVNRSVDVEVVIDYYQGKGASESVIKLLKSSGVNVRISQGGPLLHHKFMLIDNTTLVNGSTNWTKAAFTQNDDCFIVLKDLSQDQKEKLESLWKKIWSETINP